MKFKTLLEAVNFCNSVQYKDIDFQNEYHEFIVDGTSVGAIKNMYIGDIEQYIADRANNLPLFKVTTTTGCGNTTNVKKIVTFADWCNSRTLREHHVATFLSFMREKGCWECLKKWRDELYPIYGCKSEKDRVFLYLERAAAQVFGIRTYGVHLNGYVIDKSVKITASNPIEFSRLRGEQTKMWVAKRSNAPKKTYPGMLDQIVAGGISAGESPQSSLVRECFEEAGGIDINKSIETGKCIPAGTIQYYFEGNKLLGLQPETQYVYDVEMEPSVVPFSVDDEVESFQLLTINEILDNRLLSFEFKPNCLLVVVDFLIRHGFITASNEPEYLNIIDSLHAPLPFPGP
ncbi:hypothetical protein AX774_g580 [Zancudomyces culisetae]|uniref:Nudix hydrolase domain-containing protein n=1 Tax=Zancudomyces culisetae TaxID=1213189 RepID=A0A1R1PY14_ZANCU|nr:hypothetical protein AX774_g580 [Zancudomyces culisetae]|eukprot:OMH85865.1 hypothetical protein AX774_g580 [Zancudomyces culisetae]